MVFITNLRCFNDINDALGYNTMFQCNVKLFTLYELCVCTWLSVVMSCV